MNEPDSDECVERLGEAFGEVHKPTIPTPYWIVRRWEGMGLVEHRGWTMKDAFNDALAAHEGFDRHAADSGAIQ